MFLMSYSASFLHASWNKDEHVCIKDIFICRLGNWCRFELVQLQALLENAMVWVFFFLTVSWMSPCLGRSETLGLQKGSISLLENIPVQ